MDETAHDAKRNITEPKARNDITDVTPKIPFTTD